MEAIDVWKKALEGCGCGWWRDVVEQRREFRRKRWWHGGMSINPGSNAVSWLVELPTLCLLS